MKILGVLNRKGGTGKTTIAVNLAACFAEHIPVVLIDADPQGSALLWLGEDGAVDVRRVHKSAAIGRELDAEGPGVIVVDGPPFDAAINQVIFQRADLILVPITPSGLDVAAAAPLLRAIVESKKPGLVVLNMVHPQTTISKDARVMLEKSGVPVAKSVISRRVAHPEAPLVHKAVIDYAPSRPAAIEIRALAGEVAKLLKG